MNPMSVFYAPLVLLVVGAIMVIFGWRAIKSRPIQKLGDESEGRRGSPGAILLVAVGVALMLPMVALFAFFVAFILLDPIGSQPWGGN